MVNKIIDYAEMEKPIIAIEKILKDYDIQTEQGLIISMVLNRLNAVKQKQTISENTQTAIQSMSLKNVFKAMKKKDEDEDEEYKK